MGQKELKIEKKIILIILGLCLIYNIALIFSFEKIYPEKLKVENMIAEVVSLKQCIDYGYKYEIKVEKYNLKFSKNTKLILYSNIELFPGDIILINGKFEKSELPTNYKQFNYRNYLKQLKIYGIMYTDNINLVSKNKDLYYIFGTIRSNLLEKIKEVYDEKTYRFMQGILLGDTSNLDEEIKSNFESTSTSHILAISGLHISITLIFVNNILKLILENKNIRNIILVLFLIFFFIVTGMKISCFRAIIMVSINLLSSNFKRKNNFIPSLIFSFLIIISTNIYNIFSIGLWLSFMGILGIHIFSKMLSHFIKIKNKNLIIPCIASQILILPITIYSFNIFSITFLISNIIIVFFIDKIIILGYLSILLNLKTISYINSFLVSIIFEVSKYCSLGKIYLKTPNIIFIIIYYAIVFACYFYSYKYKFKFWKTFLNKKFLKKCITCIFIFIFIINIVKIKHDLRIFFIDIGQGDSTVIKTPMNKSIIIDAGEENNIIMPYILDRGINKIDYLIISHFDSDHFGGTIKLLKEMKVEKVIIAKQFKNSSNYKEFLNIVKEKHINIETVTDGDKINIEKNLFLEILWPNENNVIGENSINNNALVCKLNYGKFSMLFTGDIEKEAEEVLVSKYRNTEVLKSDILKVAHHGSKTSSTEELLNLIKPQIALIGVGKENKFGHPNLEVLERLKKLKTQIYRTDEVGEINIKINSSGKISIRNNIEKFWHTTNRW